MSENKYSKKFIGEPKSTQNMLDFVFKKQADGKEHPVDKWLKSLPPTERLKFERAMASYNGKITDSMAAPILGFIHGATLENVSLVNENLDKEFQRLKEENPGLFIPTEILGNLVSGGVISKGLKFGAKIASSTTKAITPNVIKNIGSYVAKILPTAKSPAARETLDIARQTLEGYLTSGMMEGLNFKELERHINENKGDVKEGMKSWLGKVNDTAFTGAIWSGALGGISKAMSIKDIARRQAEFKRIRKNVQEQFKGAGIQAPPMFEEERIHEVLQIPNERTANFLNIWEKDIAEQYVKSVGKGGNLEDIAGEALSSKTGKTFTDRMIKKEAAFREKARRLMIPDEAVDEIFADAYKLIDDTFILDSKDEMIDALSKLKEDLYRTERGVKTVLRPIKTERVGVKDLPIFELTKEVEKTERNFSLENLMDFMGELNEIRSFSEKARSIKSKPSAAMDSLAKSIRRYGDKISNKEFSDITADKFLWKQLKTSPFKQRGSQMKDTDLDSLGSAAGILNEIKNLSRRTLNISKSFLDDLTGKRSIGNHTVKRLTDKYKEREIIQKNIQSGINPNTGLDPTGGFYPPPISKMVGKDPSKRIFGQKGLTSMSKPGRNYVYSKILNDEYDRDYTENMLVPEFDETTKAIIEQTQGAPSEGGGEEEFDETTKAIMEQAGTRDPQSTVKPESDLFEDVGSAIRRNMQPDPEKVVVEEDVNAGKPFTEEPVAEPPRPDAGYNEGYAREEEIAIEDIERSEDPTQMDDFLDRIRAESDLRVKYPENQKQIEPDMFEPSFNDQLNKYQKHTLEKAGSHQTLSPEEKAILNTIWEKYDEQFSTGE